jgi:hypothetical protein
MDTIKVEPYSFCSTQISESPTNLRISLAKHMLYKKLYNEIDHNMIEILNNNHIFNEDKYFTEKWKQFSD